jgi:peptide chain release factor 3
MLLDAAKGLEPQTMKLFDVCRHRGIPVLTVVNKWDRPGLEALQLMDEIRERTGLEPTPLTWPVGIAGRLPRGARPLDRRLRALHPHRRRRDHRARGARPGRRGRRPGGRGLGDGVEESELLDAMGQVHDQASFLSG